jgi:hypothetical protein
MSNPGAASSVTAPSQGLNSPQALRLLTSKKLIDVNALGDTALPIINSNSYSVKFVVVTGSISLTTAAAGLFAAPAAAGTAIVSNGALSGVSGSTVVVELTVNSTAIKTAQTLYFNVATVQGAAATLNIFVYGYDFS